MYCVYLKNPYRAACTSHSRTGWWSTTGAPCSQTDFTSTCQCFGCFSKYLFLYAGFICGVNLRTISLTLELFGSYIRMKAGTRRLTVQCERGSVRSVRAARRVHLRCPGAFELRRACKQVFDWSTRCQRLVIVFVCQYNIIIMLHLKSEYKWKA